LVYLFCVVLAQQQRVTPKLHGGNLSTCNPIRYRRGTLKLGVNWSSNFFVYFRRPIPNLGKCNPGQAQKYTTPSTHPTSFQPQEQPYLLPLNPSLLPHSLLPPHSPGRSAQPGKRAKQSGSGPAMLHKIFKNFISQLIWTKLIIR